MISDEQAEQFVRALHEKTQRDQEPKTIILDKTLRGFQVGEFRDLSGAHCSIQKSSLATDDAIWLGVDVAYDGEELLGGRMQINRQMVQALLPLLSFFVETGELSDEHLMQCDECREWHYRADVRGIQECPECGADWTR